MGTHEDQLRDIAHRYYQQPVSLPGLPGLQVSLEELAAMIDRIVDPNAWSGIAAEAAGKQARLTSVDIRTFLAKTHRIAARIEDANRAISHAAAVVDTLPGHDLIGDAADTIASLLGDGREESSRKTLNALHTELSAQADAIIRELTEGMKADEQKGPSTDTGVPPLDGGDGTGNYPGYGDGSGSSGGFTPGGGTGGPGGGGTATPHHISVDGNGGGQTGGLPGGGGGHHLGGGAVGGSGLVPGLGGAAGAMGLGVAARAGGLGRAGGGGGGLGAAGTAGARLGRGAASGAPGSAGSGAAAGGRGGTSMMGGGGAGGAAKEEKRSTLGGLIAPKLEDDEEIGPRSAGAGAGGRQGAGAPADGDEA